MLEEFSSSPLIRTVFPPPKTCQPPELDRPPPINTVFPPPGRSQRPELDRLPPADTVVPSPTDQKPELSSQSNTESLALSSRLKIAPESIASDWAAPKVEIV